MGFHVAQSGHSNLYSAAIEHPCGAGSLIDLSVLHIFRIVFPARLHLCLLVNNGVGQRCGRVCPGTVVTPFCRDNGTDSHLRRHVL